jgi:hypothetical protein
MVAPKRKPVLRASGKAAAKKAPAKKAPPRRTITVTRSTVYKFTQAEYDEVLSQALDDITDSYRYTKVPRTTRVTVEGVK